MSSYFSSMTCLLSDSIVYAKCWTGHTEGDKNDAGFGMAHARNVKS